MAKTLIQYAREVTALLGIDTSVYAGPDFAVISARFETEKGEKTVKDVALYGPSKPRWRQRNEKIIAELKEKAKPKATA
jgi:spore coat polysaccharide biosynthesis predicted glycosyltransferase SpsG